MKKFKDLPRKLREKINSAYDADPDVLLNHLNQLNMYLISEDFHLSKIMDIILSLDGGKPVYVHALDDGTYLMFRCDPKRISKVVDEVMLDGPATNKCRSCGTILVDT